MQLNNLLKKRYAPAVEAAAKKIARELPAALDAQVLAEFADCLQREVSQSGEVVSLAGYLARWRRRAAFQWFAATGITIGALASGLSPYPYQQIGLASIAGAGYCLSWQALKQREEIAPILEVMARIQAAQSSKALLDLWNSTAPLASIPQTQTAQLERPILPPETVKLFDWGELKRDPDGHPNLLVVGASGSGKTYSTERILRALGSPIQVITTKRKPNQWAGLKVVGAPSGT